MSMQMGKGSGVAVQPWSVGMLMSVIHGRTPAQRLLLETPDTSRQRCAAIPPSGAKELRYQKKERR